MTSDRLVGAQQAAEFLAHAAGVHVPSVHLGEVTGIALRDGRTTLVLSRDVLAGRSDLALLGVLGHELGHLLAGHLNRPLTTRWRRFEYLVLRVRFEIEANSHAVDLVGTDALVQSYVEEINAQLGELGHRRTLTAKEVLSGESRFLAAELDQLARVVSAIPSDRAGITAGIATAWGNEMAEKYQRRSLTCR